MAKNLSIVFLVCSVFFLGLGGYFSQQTISLQRNALTECQEAKQDRIVTTSDSTGAFATPATAAGVLAATGTGTAVSYGKILTMPNADIAEEPKSLRVEVGPDKQVKVVVWIERGEVVGLVSSFFSKGDEGAKEKFESLLKTADHVTLELTTIPPEQK